MNVTPCIADASTTEEPGALCGVRKYVAPPKNSDTFHRIASIIDHINIGARVGLDLRK